MYSIQWQLRISEYCQFKITNSRNKAKEAFFFFLETLVCICWNSPYPPMEQTTCWKMFGHFIISQSLCGLLCALIGSGVLLQVPQTIPALKQSWFPLHHTVITQTAATNYKQWQQAQQRRGALLQELDRNKLSDQLIRHKHCWALIHWHRQTSPKSSRLETLGGRANYKPLQRRARWPGWASHISPKISSLRLQVLQTHTRQRDAAVFFTGGLRDTHSARGGSFTSCRLQAASFSQ